MYFIYGNNRSVSYLIFMIKDIFSHESAEIVDLDRKWHMMANKYEKLMDTKTLYMTLGAICFSDSVKIYMFVLLFKSGQK